jgi:hypothetical protein
MQEYSIVFLLLLAHLAKAPADAQAHGSPRLVRWFPHWAGPESWRLKYRGGAEANGPAFPLSTTALVALTDLWHFANLLAWLAWAGALLLACFVGRPALWYAVGGLVAGKLLFEPLYAYLRK